MPIGCRPPPSSTRVWRWRANPASPLAGPNARRIRDDVMGVLADAGLSPEDALDANRVFFGYIFGDTRPANADVNYLTRHAGPERFARGLDIIIAGIATLADRR